MKDEIKNIISGSRLVLCLHCVHWGGHVRAESLAEYPLRSPDEEWRDGVCDKLKRELEIGIDAGWEGGSVGYIRTTASFGCAFGELSPENADAHGLRGSVTNSNTKNDE